MAGRLTHGALCASALAAISVVLSGSACSELMEFQHSPPIECVRNSDCNPCDQESCDPAVTNLVCSLASHTCVDEATIGVSQDASTDGDVCAQACPEFSICRNQACLDFERHGYTGVGPLTEFIGQGQIAGIQMPLDVCGVVTGIGFVVANAPTNQRFRFGLYSDNGGQPDKRIAQTATGTVELGANEVPVEAPALLGCTGTTLFYWLVGAWDTNSMNFESEVNPIGPWIYADIVIGDVLDGGLPAQFPAPTGPQPPEPQPHLYLLVAQSN